MQLFISFFRLPTFSFILLIVAAGCEGPHLSAKSKQTGTENLLCCDGSTNSSPTTVFWGTLNNPGRFFVGRHVENGLGGVLTILSGAKVTSVAVEWQTNLTAKNRGAITERFSSFGVNVDEFWTPSLADTNKPLISKGRKRETGAVTFLSSTLLDERGGFIGNYVGTNVDKAATILVKAGIKNIEFESAFKLTPDDKEMITRAFGSAGVTIVAFWVPWGRPPGVIDLKNPH
jgi:hypothetical protein